MEKETRLGFAMGRQKGLNLRRAMVRMRMRATVRETLRDFGSVINSGLKTANGMD